MTSYYSQKANPNATNSEMESKQILKPNKIRSLTSEQRDELISQFVEIQVDNMDVQTMVEWITDELINDYTDLDDPELEERITIYDDGELYEELIENVSSTEAN
tara:strand:+ start:748 stop:1059 length:312 start_codon:yes stop_codon:yes gene_type:complete